MKLNPQVGLVLVGVSLAGAGVQGQAAAPPAPNSAPPSTQGAAEARDAVYVVSAFIPRYLRDHPQLPAPETVLETTVKLSRIGDAFIAPTKGFPTERLRLRDLNGVPHSFHASAIQAILEAIRDQYLANHFMGVFVAPDPFEINENGDDLRAGDDRSLHLVITVGIVNQLRTVASGGRINPEKRINNPAHARIRRQSPIQPVHPGQDGADKISTRSDLLRKDRLDDYVYWLSRHPGRRADVALSPSAEAGGVTLDYLITENKPWSVYAQVSNTGTAETSNWRERFGAFHNQLTGNDDILGIDYITASFGDTEAVTASYDSPIGDSRRFRYRVYGVWSKFTASDVGFAADTFEGQDWNAGGELTWNFFQHRNLFLDAAAGARFENIKVSNSLPGSAPGEEDFLFPYLGLRLEQQAEWHTTRGALTAEWMDGDATGVGADQLNNLGRPLPDRNWAVLRFDLTHSVYLEPLIFHQAWEDPASEHATLAHEVFFAFRGQYAFDYRLIPHQEEAIGGLYSVRGYPESAVAGDTVVIGTAEYRYHVPRALKIQEESGELFGKPFRYAPQYPYGTPDWDLMLKAFIDAGRANTNGGETLGDFDATLVGAGIGAELTIKRNLSLRLDWGFALKGVEERNIDAGSNRLHFVATILY
jgi:hemolysin activation/secretion protein